MSEYNRITDYQRRVLLKGLFAEESILHETEFPTVAAVLDWAVYGGLLKLPPGETDSWIYIPERLPLLADLRAPQRSVLLGYLHDRPAETIALVADSLLTKSKTLFLAVLYTDPGTVMNWVNLMPPERVELWTKPVDEQDKVLLAPLAAFVQPSQSGL
jgi:hypothetical protein